MVSLRKRCVLTVAVVAVVGGVLVADVGAAVTPKVSVVASGLNNPRGVAFAHGRLYVAEAGKGGTDCPAGAKGPEGGPVVRRSHWSARRDLRGQGTPGSEWPSVAL
jgi:hypothetical protein